MENINVIVTETPEIIKITITDYQEIVSTFIKEQSANDFVTEAPIDGSTYGRKDKAWTDISGKVDGTGTTNYVAKWLDTDTIQNSIIFDNGTNVGIGTSSPTTKLQVSGKSFFVDDIFTLQNKGIFFNGLSNYSSGISGADLGTSIRIFAGGSEKVRIKSSGKVGIGTSSPLGNLDVTGNNPTLFLVDSVGAANSKRRFLQSNSHKLYFGRQDDIGGSTVYDMLIDSNGNIGIGTTSPSYKLHVIGTSRLEGRVTLGGNVNNFIQGTGSSLDFKSNGEYNFTKGSDTLLRILSNGNVGIGTTSPSQKLDVAGTGKFTGQVTIPATPVATTDAASKSYVDAQVGTADTLSEVLALGNTSGANDISMLLGQRIYFNNDGENIRTIVNGDLELNSRTDLRIKANNNSTTGVGLEFWNGGSEKMRVNSDGNVGIGTTNPTQLLDVVGANAEIVISDSNDAPALRFRNSGSTAAMVEANSAKDMLFKTGGVAEQMRITSIGNVGIGTTNPTRELEVQGTGNVYIKVAASTDDDSSSIELENTQNTWTIRNDDTADDALKFQSAGGTKATILKNGNVGIGTTSPSSKLEIQKGSSGVTSVNSQADALFLQNSSSTGITIATPDANKSSIFFSSASRQIGARINWGYNDLLMTLGTATSNASLALKSGNESEAVRILSNGNVGIGTTNPDSKLDLSATAPILTLNSSDNSVAQGIEWKHSGNRDAYIKHLPFTGEFEFNVGRNTTWGGDFKFVTDTYDSYRITKNDHRFFIVGSEKMRINSAGNVGIGTTAPEAKLDVESEILISGTDPILRMERGDGFNSDILKVESSTDNLIIGDTSLDDIIFEADNGEAMRISSNLNVGIGTTNAVFKLDVESTSVSVARFKSTGAKAIIYLSEADDGGLISTEANRLCFGSGAGVSTANMNYHMGTQRLGIGTASPLGKLHVESESVGVNLVPVVGADELVLENSGDAGLSILTPNTNKGSLVFGDPNDAFVGGLVYDHSNDKLTFKVNNSDEVTIDSSGKVGIGTTSPIHTLTVNGGDIAVNNGNSFIVGGAITGNTAIGELGADAGQLQLLTESTRDIKFGSTTHGNIMFLEGTNGNVGIGTTTPNRPLAVNGVQGWLAGNVEKAYMNPTSTGTDFNLSGSSGPIRFDSRSGSNSYINTGNLGIGTTTPTNKLDIRQSTSGGSDVSGTGAITIGSDNPYWTFRGTATSLQDLAFDRSYAGTWYESMRIQRSTGNVGIGTTTPLAPLDVVGMARMDEGITENIHYIGTAIEHWGDGGTGLHFPANDTITLKTSSSERLRVDSAGNVGIGTTSPSVKLEVASGHIRLTDAYSLQWGSANNRIYNQSSNTVFVNNANESMRILTNGNVGMGTSTPTSSLHIGDGSGAETLSIQTGNSNDAKIAFLLSDGTERAYFKMGPDEDLEMDWNVSDNFIWKVGGVEKGRFTGAGNLGIGTTNPGKTLQVGESTSEGVIRTVHSDGSYIDIHGYGVIMSRSNSYIRPVADLSQTLYIGGGSHNWNNIVHKAVVQAFGNGTSEWMRITSTGNIGIGTTSPSRRLEVAEGFISVTNTASSGGFELKRDGLDTYQIRHLDGGFTIFNSTDSRKEITFNGAGNVGIGTTSPSEKLEVSGNILSSSTSNTFIDAKAIGANAYIRAYSDSNSVWLYQGGSSSYLQSQSGSTLRLGSGTANLVITDNSGEVMRTSSGNVGIGTTSPSQKLEVNGNIQASSYKIAGATVLQGNANVIIGSGGATGKIQLNTISGTGLVLDGSNVGIGTTSPSYKLDVVGTFRANNFGSIQGVDTGNPSAVNNEVRISGYGIMGNRGSLYFTNRLAAGTLQFGIGGVHGSGTKMLINSDGYVGIGITGPQEKLHIIGSTLLSNNNSYKIERIDGTNIPVVKLSSSNVVEFGAATSTSGATMFNFKTSGDASKMVILGSGNVGIGTTSPTTKLNVSGNISVTSGNYLSFIDSNISYNKIGRNTSVGGIQITTGASATMNLLDNGNIGIGTTSPGAKLEVVGQDANFFSTTSNQRVKIGRFPTEMFDVYVDDTRIILTATQDSDSDGNHSYILDREFAGTGDNNFEIRKSNSIQLLIDKDGKVGIGTTSPGYKLEVNSGTSNNIAKFVSSDGGGVITVKDSVGEVGFSNVGNDIFLKTSSSQTNRMSILNSGNVGIGTNTPQALLDVSSTINGVLLPRMTTTQVNAISSPSNGLTVYNITLNTLCFYNGSSWQKVNHATM